MFSVFSRRLVAACSMSSMVVIAACGGGGGAGSGGQNQAASVLADDAGVYVPTSGPTKYYRGRDARVAAAWPEEGYENTETWSGSGAARGYAETNGLNANAGVAGAPAESVALSVEADGVHERSAFAPGNVLILRSPVRQGDRYTALDATFAVPDADGDGREESARVVVEVEVVGREAVTVQAGSFPSALKVVTSAVSRVTGSSVGAAPARTATATDWYVPSIGRVKTIYADGETEPGKKGNTVVEELAGYQDTAHSFGHLQPRQLFAGRALDNTKAPPGVDTDGSGFLVALPQGQIPNNSNVGVGPVLGTVLDDNGTPGPTVTLFNALEHGGQPAAVAWGGAHYLVVARNNNKLVVQRVTATGSILDGASGSVIVDVPAFAYGPAMARMGNRVLLAWTEDANAGAGAAVHAMLLDAASGQPVSRPVAIDAPNGHAGYPKVASDGANFLVVFADWADGNNRGLARAYDATLYAARIGASGTAIDPQPRAISAPDTAHGVADLRFDGDNYVVTWADNRNHLQAPHGGVFPPEDGYTGTFRQDIFMTRVSPATGAVLAQLPTTGQAITSIPAYRDAPSLAITGNQVVEVHNVFQTAQSSGVYFRRLDRGLDAGRAAALPDNAMALETLTTFASPPSGPYGLTAATASSSGILVLFYGRPDRGAQPLALRGTLIKPPAS